MTSKRLHSAGDGALRVGPCGTEQQPGHGGKATAAIVAARAESSPEWTRDRTAIRVRIEVCFGGDGLVVDCVWAASQEWAAAARRSRQCSSAAR